MPVELFPDGLEPHNPGAAIWRFMELWKFRDFIKTGALFFNRADLFPQDEAEGIPPEEYQSVLGLNPMDLRDSQEINHSIGSIAQLREGFYINCWHLFVEESAKMWKQYGKDGVAICSRYCLLKSALAALDDRAFLGLVRYGSEHLTGWNALRFITTKRQEYEDDREVRALIWMPDQVAGGNRHFDENNIAHTRPLTAAPDRVPQFLRRRIDPQILITEIVVTPWATGNMISELQQATHEVGYAIPIRPSNLARFRDLLPETPEEWERFGVTGSEIDF